jgi:hypothetical protein
MTTVTARDRLACEMLMGGGGEFRSLCMPAALSAAGIHTSLLNFARSAAPLETSQAWTQFLRWPLLVRPGKAAGQWKHFVPVLSDELCGITRVPSIR